PMNPSDGFPPITYAAIGGGGTGAGPGGGAAAGDGGPTLAAGGFTPDVAVAGGAPAGDAPLTSGVTVASLQAGGSDDDGFVGMASPKTGGASSLNASPGFGFDGPPSADAPPAGSNYGGMMLAGLVGVGVLGAGWAWKSLVV
ncbi:MAG: hypothetical protein FJ027_15535, partial [Candidatus Rokubacteria bacterium]|nr:hypothetical protein [Candidatus Rokubacteria bacterium]